MNVSLHLAAVAALTLGQTRDTTGRTQSIKVTERAGIARMQSPVEVTFASLVAMSRMQTPSACPVWTPTARPPCPARCCRWRPPTPRIRLRRCPRRSFGWCSSPMSARTRPPVMKSRSATPLQQTASPEGHRDRRRAEDFDGASGIRATSPLGTVARHDPRRRHGGPPDVSAVQGAR